jgi:ribokinase
VVFANADESSALTGAEPAEAARLLARHFELACVTTGADGAIAAIGDDVYEARPDAPRPVESWGAGDAFAGTLLAALTQGRSVADALATAVASS